MDRSSFGTEPTEPNRTEPGTEAEAAEVVAAVGAKPGATVQGQSKQINQPKNATIAHKLYSNFFKI